MNTNPLDGMTQTKWDRLTLPEREAIRDYSQLTPQLIGHEGWRVEITTSHPNDPRPTRRFIVGRSTGWRPIHLEIARRNCHGGPPADREYRTVRRLYRTRRH